MTTMHDSQLAYAIARDPWLAQRIHGTITRALAATDPTDTERELLERQLPVERLAAKVAENPAIFTAIRAAYDADETGASVAQAIQDGLNDSDLSYVILAELSFLQT